MEKKQGLIFHLAVLVIFVNCVNDEISLVGWKYYSKATIGICGEHQTNLGALTTNGLIMLVFLIYKFRISHLHPFCKSQDVSEVSEVCQGGVGGSLRGVKPIFSMPIFSLHYLHRPGHLAVCLTCHGFRGGGGGGDAVGF